MMPDAKPFAIVAETVKGWGFVQAAGEGLHGKPLTGDDKLVAALAGTRRDGGRRWGCRGPNGGPEGWPCSDDGRRRTAEV